jgi:hypothetical protein
VSAASVLTLPVPGWYPDPAGIAAYRWWDGVDWTEGTHDGAMPHAPAAPTAAPLPAEPAAFPPIAPEPVAPAALAPEPAEPEPAAFEPVVFEAAVFEPAARPTASAPASAPAFASVATPAPASAPAAPRTTASAPAVRRGVSAAKTRWSTILTAYPFVYPFAVGTIVGLAYAGGSSTSPSTLALIAGATAFVLLLPTFLLAERDRKELADRGYQPAPSVGWLLLLPPIAYLIARRRLVGPA